MRVLKVGVQEPDQGPYTGSLSRNICAWSSFTYKGYCSPGPTNPAIMCQKVTTSGGAVVQQRHYYCMAMLSSGCCYYISSNCFYCNGMYNNCVGTFKCTYGAVYYITDCTSSGCYFYMPKGVRYGGYSTCNISTNNTYMRYNTVCCIAARYNLCHCTWHNGCAIWEYTWVLGTYNYVCGGSGTMVSGIISQSLPYNGTPQYLYISSNTRCNYICMYVYYSYDVRPWTSSLKL